MSLGAALVFAVLAATLVACEGHPGRKLGFRTTNTGEVVVHYKACNQSDALVTGLKLVEVRGRVYGDEDDPVLWEVENAAGLAATRFTLGVLPPGFEERVALSEPPPAARRLGLLVHTTTRRASETFTVADLRPDFVLSRGEYLTEGTFFKKNTCL